MPGQWVKDGVRMPHLVQKPNMVVEKSKKEQVLAAAARLFRDKGYSATSMRDLARAVDLKASSLYNYIPSKAELLKAICFDQAQHFLEGLTTVEQQPGDPASKVEALLRLHIARATQDLTSIMAFNDEWRHLEEPFLSEFIALRRDYEQRFRQIIEEGMQAGIFAPGNSNVMLYTLFSGIRWLHDWYKPGRSLSSTALADEVIGLLLNGLRRHPAPPASAE